MLKNNLWLWNLNPVKIVNLNVNIVHIFFLCFTFLYTVFFSSINAQHNHTTANSMFVQTYLEIKLINLYSNNLYLYCIFACFPMFVIFWPVLSLWWPLLSISLLFMLLLLLFFAIFHLHICCFLNIKLCLIIGSIIFKALWTALSRMKGATQIKFDWRTYWLIYNCVTVGAFSCFFTFTTV